MFRFWGSQEQQSQPRPQNASSQSFWYPPVGNSSNYSRPSTPSGSTSGSFNSDRPVEKPLSPSHVSPAEAAGMINQLKDKSVEELRKLLSDKDAYDQFLLSLDQIKLQNNLRDELWKETLQLAGENIEKEPQIVELQNQCQIIRTTELAAAQEKLSELERQKDKTLKSFSSASLLQKLHDEMIKTDEESDASYPQLVGGELDLTAYIQRYKKLRTTYHRRALIHLAAKTSAGNE